MLIKTNRSLKVQDEMTITWPVGNAFRYWIISEIILFINRGKIITAGGPFPWGMAGVRLLSKHSEVVETEKEVV